MRTVPFRTDGEVLLALDGAIAQLQANRILAYPTETVYGVGGAVTEAAVQSLANLKERSESKPFLILVASGEMLAELGVEMNADARALAARYWPGRLSLVLRARRRLPDLLRGEGGGVAVRWTPHRGITKLLLRYGKPITSTSANAASRPPMDSADAIADHWSEAVAEGELLVLDGGVLPACAPSTVVDCTRGRARVVRSGAISAGELRGTVADLIGDD